MDAQADLSLRWAHSHFEAAHIVCPCNNALQTNTCLANYPKAKKNICVFPVLAQKKLGMVLVGKTILFLNIQIFYMQFWILDTFSSLAKISQ